MTAGDFTGRTAVITGGARGIGLAVGHRLAAGGAKVALWDLDETALPPRVTREERRANLEAFARFGEERGVGLVVIHPSYRDTAPHHHPWTGVFALR